jgi:hypothetical protein
MTNFIIALRTFSTPIEMTKRDVISSGVGKAGGLLLIDY